MSRVINEVTKESIDQGKPNPYFSIWFNPSKTINAILAGEVKYNFLIPYLILSLSGGITSALKSQEELAFTIVTGIFVFAGILLMVSVIYPAIIYGIGKLWKGESTYQEVRLIISLSFIPYIILWTLDLFPLLYPWISFNTSAAILNIITWIFSVRILLIGLTKVQKFSMMYAVLNYALPALFVAILYGGFKFLK
ncbi:MAG: YIP1 family protein [Cytophagaceae bacterium]